MNNILKSLNSTWQKRKIIADKSANDPVNTPTYKIYINSPSSDWSIDPVLSIQGWLLPDDGWDVIAIRVKNNSNYHKIRYGIKRYDVAKEFTTIDKHKALHSGFGGNIKFQDGSLELEVDFGNGWQNVFSTQIKYSPEKLVEMLYDPNMSANIAEHQNILENKQKYYYETATNKSYKRHDNDPRLVAIYLPQFHPIKENNIAWGEGFTEWSNVVAAQPRFVGHQQPILPSDLGFYDLRLPETIGAQIELAKKHGIYGFCFYYYWFSGHRLLEKPLDIFLQHPEWDFNFVISWANENWTKRWDGLDNDVIVAQKYLNEDPLNFIQDVENILLDPRYIKEDNKPVLIVYRGSQLKDPSRYIKVWREYFKKKHNQELHIISVLGFEALDPRPHGFDAGMEFEPLTVAKRIDFSTHKPLPADINQKLLDKNFRGGVMDYRQIALNNVEDVFSFPTYKGVTPSWDNDARKKGNGPTITYGANADLYGKWLENILSHETKKRSDPIVFINAWNEWAEGAVLEPTKHGGHSILNRTTEVLSKYSQHDNNARNFPLHGIKRTPGTDLAVVVHVFYEKEWNMISKKMERLNNIAFDLYITITEKNKDLISLILKKYPNANITLVPNRGRDVLPFVFVATRLKDHGYQYLLKLHTKRSTHRDDGSQWLDDLIGNLLPTRHKVARIMNLLENGTAFVGPQNHFISLEQYKGSNIEHMKKVLSNIYSDKKADTIINDLGSYAYFAGSMFWCRMDSISPLLETYFTPEDFEAEKGQIDGTLAHALERLFTIVPIVDNKKLGVSSKNEARIIDLAEADEVYKYAS